MKGGLCLLEAAKVMCCVLLCRSRLWANSRLFWGFSLQSATKTSLVRFCFSSVVPLDVLFNAWKEAFLPLTTIVIIVWRIWWKVEDGKYQQRLSKVMQEYDKKLPLENLGMQSSATGGLLEIAQERSNTIDMMKIHTGNLARHFKHWKKSPTQVASSEILEC
jgi:hypothetical protein